MNELADRVRRERLARKWSVRQAANAGGISNTYWGNFEDYRQPLTPMLQEAVTQAFGWASNWPDDGVEFTQPDESRWVPLERHAALALKLDELAERVQEMDVVLKKMIREGRRGAG